MTWISRKHPDIDLIAKEGAWFAGYHEKERKDEIARYIFRLKSPSDRVDLCDASNFFLAATGSCTRAARNGERSCVAGGATAGERPPSIMERHARQKGHF